MKKKLVLVSMIIMGLLIGTSIAFAASSGTHYKVNDYGQTYGNVNPKLAPNEQKYPELIAAIGIDGTEGYVYATDVNGDQPKNPEEATAYMKRLEKEKEAGKALGAKYLRYIPLYQEDGKTVIGRFGIDPIQ